MSSSPIENVRDPSIPLCFDTCALPGRKSPGALKFLRRIRKCFPQRDLLLPAFVIAEAIRQLKLDLMEQGIQYDQIFVDNFLNDRDLAIKIIDFNRDVTYPHWLDVVGCYTDADWDETQKARFADHGMYASARARGAILVTNDKKLRRTIKGDGYHPGAITKDALEQCLKAILSSSSATGG